jgi:putative transposase
MTPPAAPERYKNHRFPGEIISHGVWLYYRFSLSYRDVQEILFERGITVTHEAVRQWCLKFGQDYANQLKCRRPRTGDKWHLEIVFAQLTKMGGLAAGSCRDGIPDFDIAIGNQHSINQEFP